MNEKFTPGNWRGDPVTGNIYPEGVEYAIAGAYSSPVSPEEYEANLRLLAHAKDLYHVAVMARVFIPKGDQIRKDVEKVLREINPDFDKRPEVTGIKKFAERVKNMRDWQKERANNPNTNTEYYAAGNEQLVDSFVAEILQEADNGKLAHAKNLRFLYFALELARPFMPEDISIRESVNKLPRESNPDFDKCIEVTDIRKFAERVKVMRDWQKSLLKNPRDNDAQTFGKKSEYLVDSIVAEILQEEQS